MEYSGTELVSYSNNQLQVSNASLGANGMTQSNIGDYWNTWHEHYYPVYYPTYHYCEQKSKIEQGFKVVGKMLENKIITKELTIKEFIKLVNDIAEIL
jgi:hypothetical protein